jgi:hypothetical protein
MKSPHQIRPVAGLYRELVPPRYPQVSVEASGLNYWDQNAAIEVPWDYGYVEGLRQAWCRLRVSKNNGQP